MNGEFLENSRPGRQGSQRSSLSFLSSLQSTATSNQDDQASIEDKMSPPADKTARLRTILSPRPRAFRPRILGGFYAQGPDVLSQTLGFTGSGHNHAKRRSLSRRTASRRQRRRRLPRQIAATVRTSRNSDLPHDDLEMDRNRAGIAQGARGVRRAEPSANPADIEQRAFAT
jgi:hypothetical protein